MRRAIAADFAALPGVLVSMTLDARLPDEPGPAEIIRVGPGEEPEILARLAASADYTLVVAPETEGLLFHRARMIEQAGGRSLGVRPRTIAEASNVLLALDRLRAAGVKVPPTRAVSPGRDWPRRITFPRIELAELGLLSEADGPTGDGEVEHPAVLKPVDGAGALNTYLLDGLADWPDPTWSPGVAALQPWIPGEPRSAAVLVGREGRPHVLGVSTQRISIDGGRFSYRGGRAPLAITEAELRMIALVAHAMPGLLGWVGIDYILPRGGSGPVVLEVNPRPTTSIVAYLKMLEPGTLARTWLGLVDGSADRLPEGFLDRLRSSIARPVTFEPDGSVHFSTEDGNGS